MSRSDTSRKLPLVLHRFDMSYRKFMVCGTVKNSALSRIINEISWIKIWPEVSLTVSAIYTIQRLTLHGKRNERILNKLRYNDCFECRR